MANPEINKDYRQNFLNILSLVFGIMAFWPYPLVWLMDSLGMSNLPEALGMLTGIILLIIAPCNGIPFGIAGVLTGIFALIKMVPSDKRTIVIFTAIIGITLGIAAITANILYFGNLQPWNSVPQQ